MGRKGVRREVSVLRRVLTNGILHYSNSLQYTSCRFGVESSLAVTLSGAISGGPDGCTIREVRVPNFSRVPGRRPFCALPLWVKDIHPAIHMEPVCSCAPFHIYKNNSNAHLDP